MLTEVIHISRSYHRRSLSLIPLNLNPQPSIMPSTLQPDFDNALQRPVSHAWTRSKPKFHPYPRLGRPSRIRHAQRNRSFEIDQAARQKALHTLHEVNEEEEESGEVNGVERPLVEPIPLRRLSCFADDEDFDLESEICFAHFNKEEDAKQSGSTYSLHIRTVASEQVSSSI
jgi:hypothetical protein